MTTAKLGSVADIMSHNVVTLRLEQTLFDGNELMREHKIRHVPVLDEQDQLAGLLDQKVVLREALRIANDHGTHRLDHYLKQVPLADVIHQDFLTLPIDTPLIEAGQRLLSHRQGALPVVDDGRLVGILSSVDFVRLAVNLLEA
ncbi:CBS domain-containing protein [Salinicola sp. LHM]|uniref:CBS domain-containing protein n=1 Tax=Salinicola sp. LHM TaxID=3065298 RepID=UPI002ACE24A1|nr:CBS domain-containing protein [Salinicola sp. LHM]WQH33161.1 CBS domain-containing protein [Salinicola sp. LHM]